MLLDRHFLTRLGRLSAMLAFLLPLLQMPETANGQAHGRQILIYRGSQQIGSASLDILNEDSKGNEGSVVQVGRELAGPSHPPADQPDVRRTAVEDDFGRATPGSFDRTAASLEADVDQEDPPDPPADAAHSPPRESLPVTRATLDPNSIHSDRDAWIHIRFQHALIIVVSLSVCPLLVGTLLLFRPRTSNQPSESHSHLEADQAKAPRQASSRPNSYVELETASAPFPNLRNDHETKQYPRMKHAQRQQKAIMEFILEDNIAIRKKVA